MNSILELPNLEHLHLDQTKVTLGILPKLKSLPKLRVLSIYHWPFTPTTGTSLLEFRSLRQLSLQQDMASATPQSLFWSWSVRLSWLEGKACALRRIGVAARPFALSQQACNFLDAPDVIRAS